MIFPTGVGLSGLCPPSAVGSAVAVTETQGDVGTEEVNTGGRQQEVDTSPAHNGR